MTRTDLHERLRNARAEREAQQRTRVRRSVARRDGVRYEVDGRWLTGFCGNDYLGIAQQFGAVAALQDAAAREGMGSTASHLVCGHHAVHDELEREVADWLEYPRALLMGSGFMANLAAVQSLLEADDVCVQDRLNHASLIDAARLADCRLRRYPHADAEGALRQLRSVPEGAAMLATDGVFSMDGDIAPLRGLSLAARMQQALLYVDDAHGIGVVGPNGRGSVAQAGLGVDEVPLQLATLGKALGGYGAVLVGDDVVIQHLSETARPYVYSTALPPAQAAAALAAVRIARRDEWRRVKLRESIVRMRTSAAQKGLELLPSDTPIQPFLCGSEARALAYAAVLENAGYWVAAIRPPTVPEGGARLRITLSAVHSTVEIDGLIDALARARDGFREQDGEQDGEAAA